MDITLTNFQLKAIADLTEAMDKPNRFEKLHRQRQNHYPYTFYGRVFQK